MEILLSMFSSLCRFHVFLIKVIYYELISKKFRLATSKRVFAHIFLYIFITFCIIWNHIGFILDEVFFPDWQNEKINDILFIVGNARSGTTLMHRLVSMDNKHFTSMQTWEIIFASSIAWRVLFWYLYDVDQTISFGFLYTCIKYIDKILFENISKIHPCGLFQPEEDEWVLIHTFQAQLILLFYPVGLEIPKPSTTSNNGIRDVYEIWTCYLSALPDFENSLSEQLKLSIFQFYKSCIRRHLYAHHHHRRRITENRNKSNQKTKMNKLIYVSKNPVFTTRLDSLYKLFPYMKVVCMIRDPGESVPSMVSYISKVWQLSNSPMEAYPNTSELVGFCVQHYLYPLSFLNSGTIVKENCTFVNYHMLIDNMSDTVITYLNTLYPSLFNAHNEKSLSASLPDKIPVNTIHTPSEFSTTLKAYSEASSSAYVSSHHYSVTECCGGLTIDQLKLLMREAYEAHPQLSESSNKAVPK